MSSAAYYLLWLAAGLAVAAMASALITWHLRSRALRRLNAARALDALERYSAWVGEQHRTNYLQPDMANSPSTWEQLLTIRERWFPEFLHEATALMMVHARLMIFFERDRMLRRNDLEAWLECDHESQFTKLWRDHQQAVGALAHPLALVARAPSALPRPHARSAV